MDAGPAAAKDDGALSTLSTPAWTAAKLAQMEVPILANDSPASLHERIQRAERELFPA